MTIDVELVKIYAGSNAQIQLDTLHFAHPLFQYEYHIVNDYREWSFKLLATDTVGTPFSSVPFNFRLPRRDSSGRQELQIVFSNMGRWMISELEAAIEDPTTPITCTYRAYLNVVDSLPVIDPPMVLGITDVSVTEEAVTCVATRFDVLNAAFPHRHFSPDEFPGLLR